jgi:Flp pilus assembly protein TadD
MSNSGARGHSPLVSALAITALAMALGGCLGRSDDVTGSVKIRSTDIPERQRAADLAARYQAQPNNPEVVIEYARALRASGQRAQAVAVLQQASIHQPRNQALLAEYGRALAETGMYQQALGVMSRAHTPDKPDWRLLNAQGAVLDQMGNHADARRYYQTALKIVPDEPTVLSNLGLSYALSKELPRAEQTLRRAVAQADADVRIRQNLALVLGLQGKFAEAEKIAASDLPPDEARANVAYLREMLKQRDPLKAINAPKKPKGV